MKKVFPLILFTVLCSLFTASAQQGQWTWMNGDSAINSSGHYGPLGVFSPLNSPPALYEACQWTDQQGFFWLFGGCTSNNDDLWKFDPAINQWAWIKGPGIGNRPGIYGTLQVPSMTNNPGGRGFGEMSWTDNDNNLWMYGGYGNGINNSQGWLSDLWKYDISTNEWTWMSGSNTVNTVPVYGIMGVPSPLNTPGGRAESNASWVDNNNNLWLFGGQLVNTVGQRGGDLWMYNTSINQWVWMSGTNANNALPVWGIKGIPSAANMPGGRWSYAAWKSCDGDFWMFGGWVYNDMWRYNIASNMWTWMSGGNSNVNHNVTQCVPDTGKYPSVRQENRACWNLGGNNFVNYGGNTSGDLWNFNATSLEWTLMKGNPDTSSVQNSGTILVSSPTNTPGNRMGALGFKDNQGNLWLFGGINGPGYCNDMWKFIPGTTCPHILMVNNVTSSFNALPLTGCSPLTVTFNNSSINGSSFLWNFGDNTTSTSFNPIHIYSSPGTYIISLIVNSTCSSQPDTSSQIITVYPSPSTLITGISTFCQGDSSILTASANSNYHWSTGSSNQTITVNSSNTYSVTVTNTNGCTGTASQTITVHPNPTPIITGNNSFCIGDSSVLDVGSFDQYLWSTGATSQTIIVNTSGTYFVTVTNNYGCTNTASQTVTVNPNQSPLITGNSSICQGDSSTLDAGSFLHYNWSTGSSNQTITVNSSNTYSVTVTNTYGCTASASQTIIVYSNPTPIITGNSSICYGDSSILTVSSYSNYLWNTGLTSQPITVDSSNTYSVTVTDLNGCTASNSMIVNVHPNPVPIISSNGPTTFCPGDSVTLNAGTYASYSWNIGTTTQTITVDAIGNYFVTVTDSNGCTGITNQGTTVITNPIVISAFTVDTLFGCKPLHAHFTNHSINATSYLWSFSNGGTTNAVSPSHYFNTSGNYTVTLIAYDTTACGIFSDTSSQTFYYTVFIPPVMPQITNHGDTLIITNFTTGLQWYKDSTAIPGATTQSYVETANACYYAIETDTNGCKSKSDTICFTTGINELPTHQHFSLFPNPNNGTFTIQCTLVNYQLVIQDMLGREVCHMFIHDSKGKENIFYPIPDGIYFYHVMNENGRIATGKLVIIK